jgi:hypothetical protein
MLQVLKLLENEYQYASGTAHAIMPSSTTTTLKQMMQSHVKHSGVAAYDISRINMYITQSSPALKFVE